jgi:hypothetical protein
MVIFTGTVSPEDDRGNKQFTSVTICTFMIWIGGMKECESY